MRLSIVTTLFFSEKYISEFCTRAYNTALKLTPDFEIVIVNDGSPDHSMQKVVALQKEFPNIILVDLSRNFGHHKALLTGLRQATGDRIFLIDSDLEEDPELLTPLWNEMNEAPDADVVFGVQKKRKGGWFERNAGTFYYRFIYLVTGYRYPLDTLTARLMTRRYIDGLKWFDEKEFDLWTLFVLNGFVQKGIVLHKKSKGSSTYTFRRKLRIAVDIITSFSTMPLYIVALMGGVIFFTSLGYIVYLIYLSATDHILTTVQLLMSALLFLGGLVLLALGVISIYLSKMYLEIKNRPMSIIREVYTSRKQSE